MAQRTGELDLFGDSAFSAKRNTKHLPSERLPDDFQHFALLHAWSLCQWEKHHVSDISRPYIK